MHCINKCIMIVHWCGLGDKNTLWTEKNFHYIRIQLNTTTNYSHRNYHSQLLPDTKSSINCQGSSTGLHDTEEFDFSFHSSCWTIGNYRQQYFQRLFTGKMATIYDALTRQLDDMILKNLTNKQRKIKQLQCPIPCNCTEVHHTVQHCNIRDDIPNTDMSQTNCCYTVWGFSQ